MYKLKVKLEHKDAKIPTKAHPTDAGWDLYSTRDVHFYYKGQIEIVDTGISIELPQGTEAQVRPRSGLSFKHGISLVNAPGTIDFAYRGNCKVALIFNGDKDYTINKGDRIAQMVIQKVLPIEIEEVDELSDTDRGTGGFGSSGR